ncbi:hypothetical protein SAMN05444483_11173 [Salegentibacter echinorum]|uniref:Uncharacterized protein n=1 Tax=Salegentibacter echinorum TaxID=1073325 RepID=A0A1M5JM31_SALEC|nr:hypothetical protein [Salegentibacter echinorum]SHG41455.1 hypothetical protein SAMN05444483_11173 [Salegentibacter echinorum]
MAKEDIITKTIEISEAYDNMASKIFENAKLLLKKGVISYKEYKQMMDNYYLPLMNYSSKILIDHSNLIIDGMEEYINKIKNATEELRTVSKKLKKSEEIFSGIIYLLASAASVATFTLAPSRISFSAAFNTLSTSIEKLKALTKKENT